jgi:hypothetical protein
MVSGCKYHAFDQRLTVLVGTPSARAVVRAPEELRRSVQQAADARARA